MENSTAQNTEGKADLGKRFIAVIIDSVVATAIGFIPIIGGLIAAAYMVLRDGFNYEFMDNRSVGKKFVKIRPIRLDGEPMDIETSIKRNWMFGFGGLIQVLMFIPVIGWILIPVVGLVGLIIGIMEIIFVLKDPDGRRWGDSLANTKVIEVED